MCERKRRGTEERLDEVLLALAALIGDVRAFIEARSTAAAPEGPPEASS